MPANAMPLLPTTKVGLPPSPGRLIGRDRELARLAGLLTGGHTRLVTLSGLGGVGKPRLALEAARLVEEHFSDGARFVELAPFREAAHVASAISAAICEAEGGL